MTDPNGTIFFPPQASTVAADVDWLYYLIYYVCLAVFIGVVFGGGYFVWKYRNRPGAAEAVPISHNTTLEVAWSVIPLFILIVFFAYGYKGYLNLFVSPKDAIEIHVIGKKWSWSFEYANGKTVPSELRVPVHKPIKLIMNSQDVLHSFFVPAFRLKQDVIPNRYTVITFEATRTGTQTIFCTEYCGTQHSDMLAKVIVMEPAEYKAWFDKSDGPEPGVPMADQGKKLFSAYACVTCHSAAPGGATIAPALYHKFGTQEKLSDGQQVLVDENYIRESILKPTAKVVAGYQPVMPPFEGVLKDWQISALIEYIKSLK